MTLWERGAWDDQDERITVDRGGQAIESMASVPEGVGAMGFQGQQKIIAVGLEDGRIRFLKLGVNKVLNQLDVKHDDIEGVIALSFDVAGRMVSGGGQTIKVWHEAKGLPGGARNGLGAPKRTLGGEDSDSEGADGSSEEEEKSEESKRRKRKRGRGKDRSGGQQVLGFKGLD